MDAIDRCASQAEARLLTTPEEILSPARYLPTGNDYVSLPTLRPADAALERLGLLHRGLVSLLEVCGSCPASKEPGREALARPLLAVDGEPAQLEGRLEWRWLGYFVPRFRWQGPGGLELEGTIFAPVEEKGFVYLLAAHNRGPTARRVTLGLQGQWGDTLQTVFSAGRLHGFHRVRRDRWTGGPVFEVRAGAATLGWAVMASPPLDECRFGPAAGGAAGQAEVSVAAGEPLVYRLASDVRLTAGESAQAAFYFGVGRDGDGARCAAIDLARRGHRRLLERTLEWLERRAVSLPRLAGDERKALEELASRNLFFNRFYALGRFIDTEELACVTSRSPLYYVSAAFWARDTLLWSLPGLLRIDPERARELILVCYARHLRNAGVHAHYVDGTVIYPGFELDELCAYLIGLEHYRQATGEKRLFAEPVIREGVATIEQRLLARRHPREWLFETTLFPSDDPATQPYLTYDNALAARSFEILFDWEQRGLRAPGPGESNRERARRVREAIHRHLVAEGPFGPMYAWSTDLGQPPRQEIYDEPPGSLQLLSHYRLCAADDPIFVNTVKWVHSAHNPHCYLDGAFPEVGCPHAEHPFVMGLFNSLLCGRAEQAKAVLLRAPLDGGLACESFDRQSGLVRTGAAFATCAGFLGHAVCCAFGTP